MRGMPDLHCPYLSEALGVLVGSVWIFHGLYSKVLDGLPRHRQIVGRILGEKCAPAATKVIGGLEILLGLWVISGRAPFACALLQTAALVSMNALEIWRARDLLISPAGMVLLNLGLLALAWCRALAASPA